MEVVQKKSNVRRPEIMEDDLKKKNGRQPQAQ